MTYAPVTHALNAVRIFWILTVASGAVSHAASADREFRLQPKVGSRWGLQCISNLDASIQVLGVKVTPYSECETVTATIIVERINADGAADLLLSVDRVEVVQIMRKEGREEKLVYDSSAPRPVDPVQRWKDLEASRTLLVGARNRLSLKQNGELSLVAAGLDLPRTGKFSCPPSNALVFARATSVDSFAPICLPERSIAPGAGWHHDETRTEFTDEPVSARRLPSRLLQSTRKKKPDRAVSKYEGKHATPTGDVERISTAFSVACDEFSGGQADGKVDGEALFDPVSGDLLGASWSVKAETKKMQWLGTAAGTVGTHMRVTIAPINVELSGSR